MDFCSPAKMTSSCASRLKRQRRIGARPSTSSRQSASPTRAAEIARHVLRAPAREGRFTTNSCRFTGKNGPCRSLCINVHRFPVGVQRRRRQRDVAAVAVRKATMNGAWALRIRGWTAGLGFRCRNANHRHSPPSSTEGTESCSDMWAGVPHNRPGPRSVESGANATILPVQFGHVQLRSR